MELVSSSIEDMAQRARQFTQCRPILSAILRPPSRLRKLPLAITILYPPSLVEKAAVVKEAAFKPALVAEIDKDWKGHSPVMKTPID
jgi:hypothetical protein